MTAYASSGGRAFLAAAERAVMAPKCRTAVVLRLSTLAAPGPRLYHRRIARAIFQDAAHAHSGEMFELEDGDMAVLCHTSAGGNPTVHPSALPHAMSRLFRIDLQPGQELTTVWMLERDGPALLTYAAMRGQEC